MALSFNLHIKCLIAFTEPDSVSERVSVAIISISECGRTLVISVVIIVFNPYLNAIPPSSAAPVISSEMTTIMLKIYF